MRVLAPRGSESALGPDDILLVAGQVVMTGEVATIGYRQVIIAGQLTGRRGGPGADFAARMVSSTRSARRAA